MAFLQQHPDGRDRVTRLLPVAATLVALCGTYVVLRPLAPDLSAQLARAAAASRGVGLWWGGWYGGTNTATYSLLSSYLMSLVGVTAVGVVSTAIICLVATDLLRTARRPRAGAVAVALAAGSNLFSGRVTYAAGMAVALLSIRLLVRDRQGPALVLAALCGLLSPLAAVFEIVAALSLLSRQPWRRLLCAGVAAGAPVLAVAALFSQPSYMPYTADLMVYCLLVCGAVVASPVPRPVRDAAILSALLAVGAWLVHSPVGGNTVRTPMLAAAPLLIAYGHPVRRLGRLVLVGVTAWPVVTVTTDLRSAFGADAAAPYYQPLLARLPAVGTSRQRVEVIDPLNHAGSYFLSTQVPLARGWERQTDAADNPLFYDGSLTASTYEAWLKAHAVGWIAEPSSDQMDYGSSAEQSLLRDAVPSYLHLMWSSADWRLYRVERPAPVADGADTVTALGDGSVGFAARAGGASHFRVAYSALLVPRSDDVPGLVGCTSTTAEGDLQVEVPLPGRYHLVPVLGDHGCDEAPLGTRTAG